MFASGFRSLFSHLSQHQEYKTLLERYAITRVPFERTVRHFIAGETIDQAVTAVKRLNGQGLKASLDLLGESVHRTDETLRVYDRYCALLNRIHAEKLDAAVSIKLTQLGLDIDESLAARNLESILLHAQTVAPNFVRVDMEASRYVSPTLRIYTRMRERGHENVGVVLQSMLHRSQHDLEQLASYYPSVRLVKGAYKEPPEKAHQEMRRIRRSFRELTDRMLQPQAIKAGIRPAFATHDPSLIEYAKDRARSNGIPSGDFEFQMLYGFSPGLQRSLAAQDYQVRVYMPYGRAWWPYFMRRLAERPQNVWFFAKHLLSLDTLKGVFGRG